MVIDTRSFSFSFTVLTHNFQVAQMYMVMKMQQQNTNSTEGVEVLENRPFEDDEFGKGQYTLKIYRLQRRKLGMHIQGVNQAANFNPTRAVIKCLYFTRFILTIETIHTAGCGLSDNVHGLTKEQLAIRQVEALDIASDYNDYWSYMIGASNFDFSQFQSAQTGRGPLLDGWQEQCYPVMTAYKLVTIDAPYWGFGSKLEQALLAGEKALFLESHRNCFGWIDEWYGLNVDMMRELEKQSDSSLNEKLGRPGLVANGEELDCS
ncbi:cytoplasmic phosphatidylinositol transfer protein 1-like isoform X4 [Salvia hispanica]|uniref:cytoplasmic phosphatidylinositol transfer protein 1-like isoform X4 n=1 Tax=Salvia hispanica TaxID=49212 RepID=UPI002008F4D1|nr:cytoplasmic phosphatidylinositol transfer protein 1-like isoform X4 [Salvia hispanica]